MKVLVVVDMQNDFISGALKNSMAEEIVPRMASYIKQFEGITIFTRDSHGSDYLETMEGKNLPVPHCIVGTEGWEIHKDLLQACEGKEQNCFVFNKPTFGYAYELSKFIKQFNQPITEIEFCGTVTSICVLANACGIKEHMSETQISVLSDLCADITNESQEAALLVMKNQQICIK
jgi:nicotinamidase-related amidase